MRNLTARPARRLAKGAVTPSLWLTELVLAGGFLSFSLVQSVVTPALPTLQRQFATDESSVAWVMTTYFASATVCAPLIGRLGDRYGRQRLLVLTLTGLTVGCLVSAVAPSFSWLLVGRLVQGVGGGLVPLTFAIIHDRFPADRLPRTYGRVVAVLAVGNCGGLLLTGPLISAFSFRSLFWMPMILTLGCCVAAYVLVPRSPVNPAVSLAPVSAALLTIWTVALLVAMIQVQNGRVLQLRTALLAVLAATFFVGWLRRELTVASPLVDIRTMRIPTIFGVNALTFVYGFGSYGAFVVLPLLLQSPQGHGLTINEAALFMLPETITSFIASYFGGRLALKYGNKLLMTVGLMTSSLGYLAIGLGNSSTWLVAVGTTLMGVALGLTFAVMPRIIMSMVPPDQRGVASGMNANIRTLGGAVGTAVVSAVLASTLSFDGTVYAAIFFALSAVLAVSAVASTWVPPGREH